MSTTEIEMPKRAPKPAPSPKIKAFPAEPVTEDGIQFPGVGSHASVVGLVDCLRFPYASSQTISTQTSPHRSELLASHIIIGEMGITFEPDKASELGRPLMIFVPWSRIDYILP